MLEGIAQDSGLKADQVRKWAVTRRKKYKKEVANVA